VTTAASRNPAAHQERPRPVRVPGDDPGDDRASWRDSAACRHVDPELFFPIGNGGAAVPQIEQAKAVCASCPVRSPCLAFALATSQEYGIWGGYDEDERRVLHRQQRESGTATGGER
jgi:WhiB family redox-sensing transcriptional regulator